MSVNGKTFRQEKRNSMPDEMLIPVSKKTAKSLNIRFFDPYGLFFLEDGRWMKIYRMKSIKAGIAKVTGLVGGRVRITLTTGKEGDRETCHLSLMETAGTREEAEEKFGLDEGVLFKVADMEALSVNEAMDDIAELSGISAGFSYASCVRGKKDWKKECLPEIREAGRSFETDETYGKGFAMLSFKDDMDEGIPQKLKRLGCQTLLAVDFEPVQKEEWDSFKRSLEKKYTRRMPASEEDILNTSVICAVMADSEDALEIIERTASMLLSEKGAMVTAVLDRQKELAESILTFGMVDCRNMRIVTEETAERLIGGEQNADAKDEI